MSTFTVSIFFSPLNVSLFMFVCQACWKNIYRRSEHCGSAWRRASAPTTFSENSWRRDWPRWRKTQVRTWNRSSSVFARLIIRKHSCRYYYLDERVCTRVQQPPTSSSTATTSRVSWPMRCDSSGAKTKSWRSSWTWAREVKHFYTCSFWYTSVQPVDKQCWTNNFFPDTHFLNLSLRWRSTLTYRCFDFLQTSRRRTRSYGRLWPGGRPNWSRAGRSAKLWGKKTADCRRGWSTAAKKTPSCRTHCTTARRSCTGTHTRKY